MAALSDFTDVHWSGHAELWLDPLGDVVSTSECTLTVEGDTVRYTWAHEGTPHDGRITLEPGGATFSDTFHQPDPMRCRALDGGRAVFAVEGAYGPDDDWGWRIQLARRGPTGELVLQMTNIAPWGEEARAVRMTVGPGGPS